MPTEEIAGVKFVLGSGVLYLTCGAEKLSFYDEEIQEIVRFLGSAETEANRLTDIETRLGALETVVSMRESAIPLVGGGYHPTVEGRDEPLDDSAPAEEVIGTAINEGLSVRFNYRGAYDIRALHRVVRPEVISLGDSDATRYFEGSYTPEQASFGYRRFSLDGIEGPVLLDV